MLEIFKVLKNYIQTNFPLKVSRSRELFLWNEWYNFCRNTKEFVQKKIRDPGETFAIMLRFSTSCFIFFRFSNSKTNIKNPRQVGGKWSFFYYLITKVNFTKHSTNISLILGKILVGKSWLFYFLKAEYANSS